MPTNARFTMNYLRHTGTSGPEGAYVWSYDASTQYYEPASSYQWNSSGGGVSILHAGLGYYRVHFDQVLTNGGTVEVTAYGPGNAHCVALGWTTETADVGCFDGAGNKVDAQFTLNYSTKSPNNIPSYTYLWANQKSASNYQPRSDYEHGVIQSECGEITMANATITRGGTGRYQVQLPGMASISSSPSNVKITATSAASETCKVVNWFANGADAFVNVACFNKYGVVIDAEYFMTFSSFAFTVC